MIQIDFSTALDRMLDDMLEHPRVIAVNRGSGQAGLCMQEDLVFIFKKYILFFTVSLALVASTLIGCISNVFFHSGTLE